MKKQLAKSEIKELMDTLSSVGVVVTKKDKVVLENDAYLYVNDLLSCFLYETRWIPTLKYVLKNDILPSVIVDMGAIKFLVEGSDVMRPGIVSLQSGILQGDVVKVLDERNKKPICICIALFSGAVMEAMKTGKVLKTIHYVGDDLWSKS
jgi:PUA-domain protein